MMRSASALVPVATRMVGLLLLAFALTACPEETPATTTVEPCPNGTEGCACYGNSTCAGDLECNAGICEPSTCTTGADGCPCFGNGTCADGLSCNGTTCEVSTCETGTQGCPCFGNATCFDGLTCQDDVCAIPACDGALGCACLPGDLCDSGLRCESGLCADCPVGTEGCACVGGTCGADLQCDDDTNLCVTCPRGSFGCACLDGGICGDRLGVDLECLDGLCDLPSCPRGAQGCLCNDDGGCDLGLECSGIDAAATCEIPAPCPAGTEGCACEPGDSCEYGLYCDGGTCAALNCTVGQLDCQCAANGTCTASGVVCDDSFWCVPATCPAGTEGCPCGLDDACGINTRGEPMACGAEGLCEAASCVPGTTGCTCAWGTDCNDDATTCDGGFCILDGCAPGTANCTCAATCADGLQCRDGAVCVDQSGYLTGPCMADGSCVDGMLCNTGGTCEACVIGTLGCDCESDDTCDPGLQCWQGDCVDPDVTQLPPGDPTCYTTCEQDFVSASGTFVQCPADRLVEGCFKGLECVDGSCVNPGTTPDGCSSDLDCNDWQACIQGGCYSNCEVDGDCDAGAACVRKVCRQTCTAGATSECPDGYSCQTGDGQVGACWQVMAPGDNNQTKVYANYEVTTSFVELTNAQTSTIITLTNNSPATETFTVRKLSATTFAVDGSSETLDDPSGDGEDCDPLQNCPLVWLSYGLTGTETPGQTLDIEVPGEGGEVDIHVLNADGGPTPRWMGRFEIVHPTFGASTVTLNYTERPEGRWNGKVYYFATFGEDGLDDWAVSQSTKNNQGLIDGVGNALVRQWAAFRLGDIDLDNFKAVLRSTRNESWRWATVEADCPAPNGACYPYDINQLGLLTYSSNVQSNPIPSGVVELPVSINLQMDEQQVGLLSGMIDSDRSLQYAGYPAFDLDFGSDPQGCDTITGGACVVFMESMSAQVYVGGRYDSTSDDANCAARPEGLYGNQKTPWLLDDFLGDTELDAATGYRYRYECRDTFLPFNDGPGEELTDGQVISNRSLALSNPIPDGRTRRRTLELVDGALINQTTLFILFKETYESFLPDPGATFSAYGYMLLERDHEELDLADEDGVGGPDVYQGNVPVDDRTEPTDLLDVSCSPELVSQALQGAATTVTAANAASLVETLITGREATNACNANQVCNAGQCCTQTCDAFGCQYSACGGSCDDQHLSSTTSEQVHYVCHDTGLFDGGPSATTSIWVPLVSNNSCDGLNFYSNNGSCDDGGPGSDTSICPLGQDKDDCPARTAADADFRVECPAGSNVTYFTIEGISQVQLAANSCNDDGTCLTTLNTWKTDQTSGVVQVDPLWRCEDATKLFCSEDRFDLRKGKVFYAATDAAVVFPSLYGAIDNAFRYKTKFQTRDGSAPGFAPQVCVPDSNAIPYCYDPPAIEALRDRVDCLMAVWRNHYDDIAGASGPPNYKQLLDNYLCTNFSYAEACVPSPGSGLAVHDGFERLYSELLVMMGDESYTNAFASRFDLAGQSTVSFEGTLFEDNGINLSGAAGFEMYSLYKASQYYQQVLDRFYGMSPLLWEALTYTTAARNFVTQETVTRYFERLIRASTQKARTWSEVAKRYQSFNEVELAKRVVQRAYTATYTENIVLAQLMLKIIDALAPEDRPQIVQVLEDGQRRYRMALLDMQNVYAQLGGEIRYFGLSPEYVPFPTVQGDTENAFEVILNRAKQKSDVARVREDQAVERSKAFETDTASFQAELVNLRNNYENQLGDLCGTFVDPDDDKVYPAITRYAEKVKGYAELGNPCGMAGQGALHDALVGVELAQLDMQRVRQSYDKLLAEVNIEKARVEAQCNLTLALADYKYKVAGKINDFQTGILAAQQAISALDRGLSYASTAAQLSKCTAGPGGTDCPQGLAALVHMTAVYAAGNVAALAIETGVKVLQAEISQIERDAAKWETEIQCDAALIDSNARMATMLLSLKEIQLEALRTEYNMRLRFSDIAELLNKAKRLEDEYEEAQQMSVNITAARNDPNVRIYRQDAIVNAEVSFDDAIREAYKATRVFEYYTSQSYAELDKLFLTRMVQFGEYNLQNYLSDLENAFFEFEELYGLPDTRVALISLRDDMLNVPWSADDGTSLTQSERINLMRDALADPTRLDSNGYLTIPFRTDIDSLSPLTRNHKVLFIEAEMIGSDVGDTIGRVYLRQTGTGTINSVEDEKVYYRFPDRTAVVNPFFNGNRFFDPSVYRNFHLRDRPLVNTNWELVINQRDEEANQDIDLQSLTDVRLFVYYQDFTEL